LVRVAVGCAADGLTLGKSGSIPLAQSFHQRKCPDPRMKRCGSKLGIDATKKLPGEGFKRPWPPPIKMDESVKAKVEKLFRS
jgi:hypothetical protein